MKMVLIKLLIVLILNLEINYKKIKKHKIILIYKILKMIMKLFLKIIKKII